MHIYMIYSIHPSLWCIQAWQVRAPCEALLGWEAAGWAGAESKLHGGFGVGGWPGKLTSHELSLRKRKRQVLEEEEDLSEEDYAKAMQSDRDMPDEMVIQEDLTGWFPMPSQTAQPIVVFSLLYYMHVLCNPQFSYTFLPLPRSGYPCRSWWRWSRQAKLQGHDLAVDGRRCPSKLLHHKGSHLFE